MTEEGFLDRIGALGAALEDSLDAEFTGNIPVCVSFRPDLVKLTDVMERVEARSKAGVVDMKPLAPEAFKPIPGLEIPKGDLYLLVDVDTGQGLLNISPEESLARIRAQGRTPLTMEEGSALAAQLPELLTDKTRYNSIQMPGSRKHGDQRVPSIWFSRGAPRLGWCWDRNVHTWLGSASARRRVGGCGIVQ